MKHAVLERCPTPQHRAWEKLNVFYHDKSVELTLPKEADNELLVGQVLLTISGQELYRVCDSNPVDGFLELVYDDWANQSYVPKRGEEKGAPADG